MYCTTIHRYPIFSMRYSVMCKVYTGYCGTSEKEHGLCVCTLNNPLAKARDYLSVQAHKPCPISYLKSFGFGWNLLISHVEMYRKSYPCHRRWIGIGSGSHTKITADDILILSFEENKALFFMWILCPAEDSLETSSLIFSEKKNRKKNIYECRLLQSWLVL